jgi:hypothetical protein
MGATFSPAIDHRHHRTSSVTAGSGMSEMREASEAAASNASKLNSPANTG